MRNKYAKPALLFLVLGPIQFGVAVLLDRVNVIDLGNAVGPGILLALAGVPAIAFVALWLSLLSRKSRHDASN